MKTLVIPLGMNNKNRFSLMLQDEENNFPITWHTHLASELNEEDIVFFPEYKKLVRFYRIKNIINDAIVLQEALGEFYWKDWDYIANSKQDTLQSKEYILDEEKTRPIHNIIKSNFKRN